MGQFLHCKDWPICSLSLSFWLLHTLSCREIIGFFLPLPIVRTIATCMPLQASMDQTGWETVRKNSCTWSPLARKCSAALINLGKKRSFSMLCTCKQGEGKKPNRKEEEGTCMHASPLILRRDAQILLSAIFR